MKIKYFIYSFGLFYISSCCCQNTNRLSLEKSTDTIPVRVSNETSLNEDYDTIVGARVSKFLVAMNEPFLSSCELANETYRFTWLRTFHHPISIRIEKNQEGVKLFWKECNGAGGYAPGNLITSEEKIISEDEWNNFKLHLEEIQFWKLSEDDNSIGLDGATWLLEGAESSQYHYVKRWSPEKNDFYNCCIYLLELTDLKLSKREIY
jgi:hypothetical protein